MAEQAMKYEENKIMEEIKMNPFIIDSYAGDPIKTKSWYELEICSPFIDQYKLKHSPNEKEWKNYKFDSLNESDIDFYKIAEDISKANPVALVDVNGNNKHNVFAVVHYSIPEKAQKVDKLRPSIFWEYFIGPNFVVYEMDHVKHFDDVIAWAKKVKNSTWPERNKATVTVSIPKV